MNKTKLMKGNEAAAEAAVIAGCRYYFGYPITPQNEIPEYMAKRLPEVDGTFIQAESEVAAINMVFGASASGARVMTSSSSPGISLKQEGISYLAAAQLPCVIIDITRGGPGLGNIAGSQGDYFQATRGGGHGDYRTIVLAPANCQELADLTLKAFDLADEYRMVVMILGDGFIGQMSEPVTLPQPTNKKFDKDWAVGFGNKRKVASLVLSPEDGLMKHNYELKKIYDQVEKDVRLYEEYKLDDADYMLVAYGTSARICEQAVENLRDKGIKAGYFRPISLWPFPYTELLEASKGKKHILAVEMSMGQMVEDVKLAVEGSIPVDFYGIPGGMIPTAEAIVEKVVSYE
ncbi:MAG: 3-methyl-2-oxobutanoate dehydrogenase subunit VorB [Spirochaetaceae bacterium 4572_7]|nr:MAG: 3-methyl-2-oxobutanoate dehydrogenase subunit VorB [Spirochaetaceae bacterium 4572_7]